MDRYAPERHDPLVMKRTNFSQAPPTFRYRGFFHDDEDLLPRPFHANGYPLQTGDAPLEWYKRFFETALRLRMNMVAPYTRVHRRYEVQKLASEWGLYYTPHHYDVLVSNPYGFDRFKLAQERGVGPEGNWFTERDGMLKYWRAGVLENRDLDVIWPVGMRGTEDRPFTFPAGTTDHDKAKTFHDVISEQVKMVRDLLPKDKTPLFHFTTYSEMLPQYQRHPAAFDLPGDVTIVWPGDNDGQCHTRRSFFDRCAGANSQAGVRGCIAEAGRRYAAARTRESRRDPRRACPIPSESPRPGLRCKDCFARPTEWTSIRSKAPLGLRKRDTR